jgi:DNA topoisomerase VI subunit B
LSGGEFVYTNKELYKNSQDFFQHPTINEELKSSHDELFCNQFTIKIRDQGPGISKEGIKNLFIDF